MVVIGLLLANQVHSLYGFNQENIEERAGENIRQDNEDELVATASIPDTEVQIATGSAVAKYATTQKESTGESLKSYQKPTLEALTAYLESINSPLAPYSQQILNSEFTGTIIGICAIEQYTCTKAPTYSPYNFWGLMKRGGGLMRFGSQEEAITYIDWYLNNRYERGRTTIESFRGYYCVNRNYAGNVCPNWEPMVKKYKHIIENL